MPRLPVEPGRKFSAILTADLHLRDDAPECRTDDFVSAMRRKLEFVRGLCERHQCPLLVAGDVFNKPRSSASVLSLAFLHLPRRVVFVTGQHDLPEHSEPLYPESGCAVLEAADPERFIRLRSARGENEGAPAPKDAPKSSNKGGATGRTTPEGGGIRGVWNFLRINGFLVMGAGWGERPDDPRLITAADEPRILLWHRMVWHKVAPFPGAPEDGRAADLLKAHKEFDLIVTGDNHQPFTVSTADGRRLVNCGSLMRTTTAQIAYLPCVYGWDADTGDVDPIPLPVTRGVVSSKHVSSAQESEQRLAGFIERVREDTEIGLDFATNLKRYVDKHKLAPAVKELLLRAIGRAA